MNVQLSVYSRHQLEVLVAALTAAHVERLSFTAEGFAKRFGFKLNRHTRAILNGMVFDGLLVKHKTLFEDGHYRMQYSAQLTRAIPWDMGKSNVHASQAVH